MEDYENRVEELPPDEDLPLSGDAEHSEQPPACSGSGCAGATLSGCSVSSEADYVKFKAEGNALFARGEVVEALAAYRKGLELAPRKPFPSAEPMEEPSEKSDDEPKKEAASQESEPDYTTTAQLLGNAGLCLMKLESRDEAIEMFSEALRHDPTYQKVYFRRAECYYQQEKYSYASADYTEYEKLGGVFDNLAKQRKTHAEMKQKEEMQKMLGDLKDLGNKCLGWFGLSTDNFKFDKDPATGSYSMRFEQ